MRLFARLLIPVLCVATLVMPIGAAAQIAALATPSAQDQTASHCEQAGPVAPVHHDTASTTPAPAHGACGACAGHCLPAVIAMLPQVPLYGAAALPATATAGRSGITTLPELKPPRA